MMHIDHLQKQPLLHW